MDEKWKAYVPNITTEEYLKNVRIANARYKRVQLMYMEAEEAFKNYKKRIEDRESREI